jgi:hypothetical protein
MEATIRARTPEQRTGNWIKTHKLPDDPKPHRLSQQLAKVATGEKTLASVSHALLALGLAATDADTGDLLAATLLQRLEELPDATLADLSYEATLELRRRDLRLPRRDTFDEHDDGDDVVYRTLPACPSCGSHHRKVRSSKAHGEHGKVEYSQCKACGADYKVIAEPSEVREKLSALSLTTDD